MDLPDLDDFTISYLETALWSSTDDNGDPLDENYGINDIAPATLAKMVADCAAFQADHAVAITGREERAGHKFWLTRNRRGSVYLSPGDDGLLYA